MATKREQILAAIKTKLTNVTNVLNANVVRSQTLAFKRAQTPAISIEPIQDVPQEEVIGYTDWGLIVRVAIIVRGDIPDQVADPVIESVHSKLLADISLGGLSMDIVPVSVNYEIIDADNSAAVVSLDYRVRYRTATGDLSI